MTLLSLGTNATRVPASKAGGTKDATIQQQLEDRVAVLESAGYSEPAPESKMHRTWSRVWTGAVAGAVMGGVSSGLGGRNPVNSTLIEGALVGTAGASLGGALGLFGDLFTTQPHPSLGAKMAVEVGGKAAAAGAVHGLATCILGRVLGGCGLAHIAGGAIAGALAGLLLPNRDR